MEIAKFIKIYKTIPKDIKDVSKDTAESVWAQAAAAPPATVALDAGCNQPSLARDGGGGGGRDLQPRRRAEGVYFDGEPQPREFTRGDLGGGAARGGDEDGAGGGRGRAW